MITTSLRQNGESWHTGMFYEQGCSHGRDMVPLEFKTPRMFDKAEERLKNHQIYHTEVYAMKDGRIEHKGTLIARYDSRHNDFRADLGEEISRSFLSLEASLALICPDYAEELRCIVQEWGVTGEDKQGILLDDGNTHIVYDGAEYIPVACGKTSVEFAFDCCFEEDVFSCAAVCICSGFCKARKWRVLRGYYRGNGRFSRCGGTV